MLLLPTAQLCCCYLPTAQLCCCDAIQCHLGGCLRACQTCVAGLPAALAPSNTVYG